MTPRTRDPESTRAAILDAAEQVILEHGFGQATTSEIARRAGVTKSLLHHHFGSKEHLWEEVKNRRFSIYAQRQLALLREGPPSEGLLRNSIRAYYEFLRDNPQMTRILVWMYLEEQGRPGCDPAGRNTELVESGVARLREAQELGRLRSDIDPGVFLMIFIGIIQHWFQDRGFHLGVLGDSKSPEQWDETFIETLTKVLLEGVLPR